MNTFQEENDPISYFHHSQPVEENPPVFPKKIVLCFSPAFACSNLA